MFRSVVADSRYRDHPWQNPRLFDAVTAPKFAAPASAPGTRDQVLTGGQLDNFVGATVHARPSDAAQAMSRLGYAPPGASLAWARTRASARC